MNRIFVITSRQNDGNEMIEGFMTDHQLAKTAVDLMNKQSELDDTKTTYYCTPTDKISVNITLTEEAKSIINRF